MELLTELQIVQVMATLQDPALRENVSRALEIISLILFEIVFQDLC